MENWGGSPVFVDLWHLERDLRLEHGIHPLLYVVRQGQARQVRLVPVTGLCRESGYQSAMASAIAQDQNGACVRLLERDVLSTGFAARLDALLAELSLRPEEVDLIVDYQVTQNNCLTCSGLCDLLPHLNHWRSFTVISGAFPPDLQGFAVGQHLLPRNDWLLWHDQVTAKPPLRRRPSYGDYTIQHPVYSEPPEYPNFSASIRYTTRTGWLIMRGEGVFHVGSPGFQQWPANAQLLCGRPEFCGGGFSYGDEYIERMSQQTTRTGSAETWLRAGINHHMTYVVRQVASLFET